MTGLTHEELLKSISTISYKKPELPASRKIGWYEKRMNKLGWFRQTTVYVIDSRKFEMSLFPMNSPIEPLRDEEGRK